MPRPVYVFFLWAATTLYALLGTELLDAQSSSAQGAANDVRAACAQDVQKLCANVPAGGGRIIACLKQHQDQVSDSCKQAIAKAMQQPNGGAGTAPAGSTTPAGAHRVQALRRAHRHQPLQKIASLRIPPNPIRRTTTF